MKKNRLYLDSSVISHLEAPDTPEKMQETLLLWNDIKNGKYDIVISSVLIEEIDKCHQPKRNKMYEFLGDIEYERIATDDGIKNIADEIIRLGILTEKSRYDCLHIACALVSSCNYIVSWNFKHLVNIKTVNGVRAITNIFGFNNIDIIAPPSLLF